MDAIASLGAASLGAGQQYYVRFGPNSTNTSYLSSWWYSRITVYTGGSTVPGGDFDIANVNPAIADTRCDTTSTSHLRLATTRHRHGYLSFVRL